MTDLGLMGSILTHISTIFAREYDKKRTRPEGPALDVFTTE